MRPVVTYGEVFGLVAVWDWLVTVSTRFIASEVVWAIPLAVALTAFWWVGTGWAAQADRRVMVAALAGAAAGTALGLHIP